MKRAKGYYWGTYVEQVSKTSVTYLGSQLIAI